MSYKAEFNKILPPEVRAATRQKFMTMDPSVKYVDVQLTPEEAAFANKVGLFKCQVSEALGLKDDRRSDKHDSTSINLSGTCAELAAVKLIGGSWDGLYDDITEYQTRIKPGAGDLNDFMDIRQTDYPNGGLIIRPKDKIHVNWRANILVVTRDAANRIFRIAGFEFGAAAKVDKYAKSPHDRPFWLVPQRDLRNIGALPAAVRTFEREFLKGPLS